MEEKAMGFNEGQLKRTGFAEAFTPELKAQMEQGVPVIQHTFKKEYENDKVTATLHLKKSTESNFYFLNKFDLQLQKEGQSEAVKQTFYLTKRTEKNEDGTNKKQKLENKYTLKEGYNLLAGRPVFKDLVNKEGQEYQAWVKINFKNKFESGNHELKEYNTNYGFDLNSVLAKYPIKELANKMYKESLVESLNRGNLQKVTFVDKEGKEEKLYISPGITLGALNVYDANKQRVPTEMLVEKNYIGKELAEQLKEFFKQKKNPEQTQKSDQTQKKERAQNIRPVHTPKKAETIKQQARKHKAK